MMLLLLSVFLAAPPTLPLRPTLTGPILDRVGFFSKKKAAEAARRINALQREYGYQLVIETTERQPDMSHLRGVFNTSARERELYRWAREKAQEAGVTRGLYLVVTRHPPDVRVAGWPDEVELTFPPYMRQRLREDFRAGLRETPDSSLGAAVDRFAELLRRVEQHNTPLESVPFLLVLASLLGVWLLLFLLHRRLATPQLAVPLYPPAVQGSIFGSLAGLWINDRLFQAEVPPPSAPVTEEEPA